MRPGEELYVGEIGPKIRRGVRRLAIDLAKTQTASFHSRESEEQEDFLFVSVP